MWATLVRMLCLALLALVPCTAGAENPASGSGKNCLWKVRSERSELYILGSINTGKREFYPLSPVIENAFRSSESLVLQIDPSVLTPDANNIRRSKARYPPGKSLETELPRDLLAKLKEQAQKFNVPYEEIREYKPYIGVETILVKVLLAAGFSREHGIERYFIEKAGHNKPILGIDRSEDVVGWKEKLSPKQQEAVLQGFLVDMDKGKLVSELYECWHKGDLRKIVDLYREQERDDQPELQGFFENLVAAKVPDYAKQIEMLLLTGHRGFVVIGIRFVGGDNGLLRRLENDGYTVEQM
jgi:uncharacterized protein YbaP (TraB family)